MKNKNSDLAVSHIFNQKLLYNFTKNFKMKRIIFILLSLFLFNCNKTPKCNDEEVQKQVILTLKKKISDEVEKDLKNENEIKNDPNYTSFLKLFKNRDKYLDELEPKFTNFRSTEINKDIQKCNCEADLNIIEKYKSNLNEIENNWVGGEFTIENFTPSIKYSAQITEDEKIYIEIENSDEIEVIKRNIFAKVLNDIRKKYQELNSTNNEQVSNYQNSDSQPNTDLNITPGNYYYVNASNDSPVHFYAFPNENDRKQSKFTSFEKVYVESISGNFGFVRFTNTNNQTSKGWIRFSDLIP